MVSFGNKYALVAHILHKNKNGLNGSNFDLIANIQQFELNNQTFLTFILLFYGTLSIFANFYFICKQDHYYYIIQKSFLLAVGKIKKIN